MHSVITVHIDTSGTIQLSRAETAVPAVLYRQPNLEIDQPIAVCDLDDPPAHPILTAVKGDPDTVAEAVVGLFDRVALKEANGVGIKVRDFVQLCAWWADVYAGVKNLSAEQIISATARSEEQSYAQVRTPAGHLVTGDMRYYPGVDIAATRFIIAVTREPEGLA